MLESNSFAIILVGLQEGVHVIRIIFSKLSKWSLTPPKADKVPLFLNQKIFFLRLKNLLIQGSFSIGEFHKSMI